MLPLGVVIPTRNSMPYLARHVDGLRPWLDLAQELVIVDSFSSDGTVEYLRQHLKHSRVTYLTHPPGLYASWNHGIRQITAKYLFIATTGDVISRAGITHLVETAEALDCEVVISKPEFQDQRGRAVDITWPIDDVIVSLGIRAPRRLHKLEALVFAAVHSSEALLGSCASNVFRTEVVQRFPFPTNFGTAGDGAWGLEHAPELVWAVTPERFSTFLIHPSTGSDRLRSERAPQWNQVLREATERWLQSGAVTGEELARIHWQKLLDTSSRYLQRKAALDQMRHQRLPWVLRPSAWVIRIQRDRVRRRMNTLRDLGLQTTPPSEASVG